MALISIREAVQALKLSEDTVRRDIDAGAPSTKDGRSIRLDLEAYVAWRKANGRTGKRGRPVANDNPDTAAAKLQKLLQEIRIKRVDADRAERKAQVEAGTHQDLEHLREMLTDLGTVLRGGVERMQKRFGAECAVLFNEILDEFEQMVQKHAGSLADTRNVGTGPSAS